MTAKHKVELVKHIFSVFLLLITFVLMACSPAAKKVELARKVVDVAQYQLVYTPGQPTPETLLELAIGGDIKSVRGEIVGLDMSMGKIPLFFKQIEQSQFVAQFLLGVCSDPDMFWQVRITVTKQDGSEQVLTDKFQALYP
jgi:hypothetical protein